MKIKVFVDDGQPESWDCNDNYYEIPDKDLEAVWMDLKAAPPTEAVSASMGR